MLKTRGYAALRPHAPLEPFDFERREPGPEDVLVEILHCGICHSDLHQVRDEWGGALFPMVPGHEIVGRVAWVGAAVTRFAPGDPVGVGCFVDSCRACPSCLEGLEQYCAGHLVVTYNGLEADLKTPTYGGYSSRIVVHQGYLLRVPERLDLAAAAPLLCAGVTMWSPLRHFEVGPGRRVGVVGLGGLGHMAVKLAAAMGAEVTVISTSPAKEADALRLGARRFVASREEGALEGLAGQLDLLLSTVSAPYALDPYLETLTRDGTMVVVGVPPEASAVNLFSLMRRRRSLAGSMIGGIRETQDLLDFCGEHGIVSDIERIPMSAVNEAYERMLRSDVRYRFVLDLDTL